MRVKGGGRTAISVLQLSGALMMFFALWVWPRSEAIERNVRVSDDYHPGLLANDPAVMKKAWLQQYRPIGWLQHEALVRLDTNYFRGRAPKILGGLCLAFAASLLLLFLRECGTDKLVAVVVSAGFVLSPLVNEITLWNISTSLEVLKDRTCCE